MLEQYLKLLKSEQVELGKMVLTPFIEQSDWDSVQSTGSVNKDRVADEFWTPGGLLLTADHQRRHNIAGYSATQAMRGKHIRGWFFSQEPFLKDMVTEGYFLTEDFHDLRMLMLISSLDHKYLADQYEWSSSVYLAAALSALEAKGVRTLGDLLFKYNYEKSNLAKIVLNEKMCESQRVWNKIRDQIDELECVLE